jgi:hypothetical protein
MPRTALVHFKEDVARARAIVAHAGPLPQTCDADRILRSDLLRSAWMFAVGALDAYFCDAYTDVVAATIISRSRHPAMTLPAFFNRIRVPGAGDPRILRAEHELALEDGGSGDDGPRQRPEVGPALGAIQRVLP